MLDFIGSVAITATMVVVINAVISTLAISRLQRLSAALAVGLWIGLAAAVPATGLVAMPNPFLYIGVFISVPLLAVAAVAALSPVWRAALLGLPTQLLIGLNLARVLGALFLVLAADGRLSGPFPYSAGWGDILVGVLALPALWLASQPLGPLSQSLLGTWNMLGALDLIVAVGLAVTSAPDSALQLFHVGVGPAALLAAPWSFIPTVLVPFFLIVHAIVFAQLRQARVGDDRRHFSSCAAHVLG